MAMVLIIIIIKRDKSKTHGRRRVMSGRGEEVVSNNV